MAKHSLPDMLQENGMVGNGGGGQGQWTLGSPPGSPYSPHLTVLVTWENKSICLCTATDKFILSVLLWPEHEYLSINDCSMGKTLHYGRGWGGLGGGLGGQKVIFICLSVLREYLGRDLVMPNLPFNFLMTLREWSMTTEGNIWRIPGNTCVHLFRTIWAFLGTLLQALYIISSALGL